MHKYAEVKQEEPIKEESLGKRIYDLLQGYEPHAQREALKEAEERIHQQFDEKLSKIKEEAEKVSNEWEIFKVKQ